MNDILFWWFLFISTFTFGYVLGSKAITKDKIITLYRQVKSGNQETKGVIKKLTPYEKRIKGTIQEETEKAMTETLDKLL